LEQSGLKPAFSADPIWLKFEKEDIAKVSTQYKTIASEKKLLQEFMPEIQTVGETSWYSLIKNSLTQSIKPVPGDFRIQVQFGGIYRLVHPDAELIAEAQKLLIHFRKITLRESGRNCYTMNYTSWKWSV
jgi:hypothetical protein